MAKVIEISSHPKFPHGYVSSWAKLRYEEEDFPPPPEPELQYATTDSECLDTLEQLERRSNEDNEPLPGTGFEKELIGELKKLNDDVEILLSRSVGETEERERRNETMYSRKRVRS